MISTTFRTDDATRWGVGKRGNLQASEVDLNFWALKTAIEDLLANPPDPIEIASFTVTGGRMSIHLTSGSTIGPLPLPILSWRWRGDWVPNVPYLQLDVFSVPEQGLFVVLLDHTSAMAFNPAAVDLGSNPLYMELIGVKAPPLTVTDGTTTVHNVTEIIFDPSVAVESLGDGAASVDFGDAGVSGIETGITAAGTNQATATALTHRFNFVSSGIDGAKGVKIDVSLMIAGTHIYVANEDMTNTLICYPDTGALFNDQSANTPVTGGIPADTTAHFVVKSTTALRSVP